MLSNHIHLLLTCELANLTVMMRALSMAYAQCFNGRHGHIGSVIQGCFMSIPTEGESHLLEAVRYIHPNPQTVGTGAVDSFPCSSYRECVSPQNLDRVPLCDASLILGVHDGSAGFHQVKCLEIEILDLVPARPIRSDAEATAIASILKAERNASLEQLQREAHLLGRSRDSLESTAISFRLQ